MAIDRRVARTRAALYDAISALMRDRPYVDIEIGEIVAAANVGRSTFYAHFRSKDELLSRSLERLRPLFAAGQAAQRARPRSGSCEATIALFRHVHAHRTLLAALEGSPAKRIILESIENELARFLAPYAVSRPGDGLSRELVLSFVTGTFVTVMSWWFERNDHLSAEEVDRHFHRLIEGGIPRDFFEAGAFRAVA